MNFKQYTTQLLTYTEEAPKRFQLMRDEDREPDFFAEVKPYADQVHKEIKEWKMLAPAFIERYDPKYFHLLQVEQVADAMEQFIVQSFYKKTSKKRFLQSVQSVHYTLSKLLKTIEEKGAAE